jgi:hypothetical protein
MLVHEGAIPHADAVHVGRGPELFALKRRHRGSMSRNLPVSRADGFGEESRELRFYSGFERGSAKVEPKL